MLSFIHAEFIIKQVFQKGNVKKEPTSPSKTVVILYSIDLCQRWVARSFSQNNAPNEMCHLWPHWRKGNTGSGNGLVLTDNKTLPEINIRVDSSFALSQWETALLCNDVSHWLGASLESALNIDLITCELKRWSHWFGKMAWPVETYKWDTINHISKSWQWTIT